MYNYLGRNATYFDLHIDLGMR